MSACELAHVRASGDIWRRTNNWYLQLAALIGYNRTRSERRVDVVFGLDCPDLVD